jgi:hypothetical protein
MPADLATLSPTPAIHGARARSTCLRRDPWRWRGSVTGEWAALLHLDVAPSLHPWRRPLSPWPPSSHDPGGHGAPRPHPPLSPLSQACYGRRWCSCAVARRQLRPRRLESTNPGFPSPMLQMYISVVSKVCCRCFLCML